MITTRFPHWLTQGSELGQRLAAATVAFSTLVAVIATAIQLTLDYRREVHQIDATFFQVGQSYLPTLANALWATNRAELQVAVEGLARLPDVRYVVVKEGETIWASSGDATMQNTITRQFVLTRVHRGQTIEIGSLTVAADTTDVYKRLWEKFWVILGTNTVKTFFVAGFMLWLFHRLVTRHLQRVAEFAAQRNTRNLDERLALDRRTHSSSEADDFDRVVEALARMQSSLADSLRALRENEQHLRTVADFTYDWEYWLAPDGALPYVSPSCERVTGYRAEEFQKDSGLLVRIVHPDDREQFAQRVYGGGRVSDQSVDFDFRVITRSGEQRWLAHVAQPVYGDSGQYLGLRASHRDITARKQAEAEIQRLNAELEQRVVERTATLERINQELESFSYSVSHDLRAPLRGIDGFSHVLLEEYGARLDATGRDYLHRVRSGAQRMGRVIDDLLRLSRITRSDMHPSRVDLSALAAEVAAELRQHMSVSTARLTIQSGLIADGDPALLRIALENLLGNAFKYSSKTDDPVIEFSSTLQNGRTVYLVRDNGAGFDMAYATKLFGAFQRLHRDEEFPGTGIGLATVRRIISRHGGEIWAESTKGKGATFYFTLGDTDVAKASAAA